MRATMQRALALVLPILAAREGAAQWNVARFEQAPNRVYSAFGMDPAFVGTVGYARIVPLWGHRVQLAGDAGIGAAGLDVNDFRARLQAYSSLVRWRSVHLTGSATFITRGTENSIYQGLSFGADLTGAAGVYRPGWFMAGEFGFDKAIITHITHSQWYRKNFYHDAKDGWYLDAGGTYHYGITGGVAIGKAELTGRFGWQRTEEWEALDSPFYGSLGLGFSF